MLSSAFTDSFLKQLAALQIASRRSFLGLRQGHHVSPRKGHGIEFSQYRQYQPGDNPRLIDWNTYARTDRLYVKQYHEEEDLLVATLIDSSQSMYVDEKIRTSIDMACALSYVALNQKDSVLGAVMGNVITPVLKSLKSINRFSTMLSSVPEDVQFNISLSNQVKQVIGRLKFPGIVYLISDFLVPTKEIEESLLALRAKNFFCHIVQILGQSDINPFPEGGAVEVVDSETSETLSLDWTDEDQIKYDTKLNAEIYKLKQITSSFGMRYSCFYQGKTSFDQFVLKELLASGGLI
jgi:hypothetical protein